MDISTGLGLLAVDRVLENRQFAHASVIPAGSIHAESKVLAETILEEHAIAGRQGARRAARGDADGGEVRSALRLHQLRAICGDPLQVAHLGCRGEARRLGDPVEVDAKPAQVALAWLISLPGVVAIPGASSVEQLEFNVAAADIELPADSRDALTDAARAFQPTSSGRFLTDLVREKLTGR